MSSSKGSTRMAFVVWTVLIPFVLFIGCGQNSAVESEKAVEEANEAFAGYAADNPVSPGLKLTVPEGSLEVGFERSAAPAFIAAGSVDCVVGELDGQAPPEAVVLLSENDFVAGDLQVFVYSLELEVAPMLISRENVHPAFEGPGSLSLADLDGDGRDEIMLLPKVKGTVNPADIHIYILKEDVLESVVCGFDPGSQSVLVNLGGSKSWNTLPIQVQWSEIAPCAHPTLLIKDEQGFYNVKLAKPDVQLVQWNRQQIIETALFEVLKERD